MKIHQGDIAQLEEIKEAIKKIHYDSLNLEDKDELLFYQARDSIDKLIKMGEESLK